MQRRRRCGTTHKAQNSQGFRRERHVQILRTNRGALRRAARRSVAMALSRSLSNAFADMPMIGMFRVELWAKVGDGVRG